jgi:molybdopterin-guanine dinucleotide biosynthesis protein A
LPPRGMPPTFLPRGMLPTCLPCSLLPAGAVRCCAASPAADKVTDSGMGQQHALAAAILAGGRARRLGGVNKGMLPLGRIAIVDRQLLALRDVASHVFVVGSESEAWKTRGLQVVPDAVPGMGALGGIYTAIVRSPCDRTLVVACDMPFVSAAFLHRLAAEEGADAVMPRSHRGCEPLCAIYSRACAPGIRARIDRGELQASTPPSGVRVAEIGPEIIATYDPDGWIFMNVNTPHDYERARRFLTTDPITTDRSRT